MLVLEPEDDAALVAYAKVNGCTAEIALWRMPTTQEQLNFCQPTNISTSSSKNPAWVYNFNGSGENGAKVISKFKGYDSSDNYIFFPASGYFNDVKFYGGSVDSIYLSSSLNSSTLYEEADRRLNGRPVRAVYKN